MLSRKIRNNATIGYFFLGWMFLLAKKNPDFADPFIQNHAKNATKGHGLFLVSYIIYSYFLSRFFFHNIPIINLSIDRVIHFGFFVALTLFILYGIYNSQKGGEVTEVGDIFSFGDSHTSFWYESATETERMMFFLSHIPFLGMIIAKRYKNIITVTGARLSSIFIFLYLLYFVSSGFDSFAMILLFIYILVIVFVWVQFFMGNTYISYSLLSRIPSMDTCYEVARSLPRYMGEIMGVIREKTEQVSFENCLKKTRESDNASHILLETYFTENRIPFRPLWIFIPLVNLVFLPKILTDRKTKYSIAIGQGLVMTGIFVVISFIYGFSSSFILFFLFPIFYAIARVQADPFQKIPVVYEIYTLINTLSFWLLRNTRKIQEVKAQEKSVSFKV